MNENDIQKLTQEQLNFIVILALRKIRTDIAFLKSKVERDDSIGYVNLFDCGVLQGLFQAQQAFRDVFYSGIWESSGGAEDV